MMVIWLWLVKWWWSICWIYSWWKCLLCCVSLSVWMRCFLSSLCFSCLCVLFVRGIKSSKWMWWRFNLFMLMVIIWFCLMFIMCISRLKMIWIGVGIIILVIARWRARITCVRNSCVFVNVLIFCLWVWILCWGIIIWIFVRLFWVDILCKLFILSVVDGIWLLRIIKKLCFIRLRVSIVSSSGSFITSSCWR